MIKGSERPVISVTMATGRQGRAVIRHLIRKGGFQIRAITRNPSSPNARKLAEYPNVEIFKGDLLDQSSLLRAFSESDGVFGNTTPTKDWKLFKGSMSREYELEQGRNLIEAVKTIRSQGRLKHFIFSSICKAKEPGKNHRAPGHFQNKWNIEELIYAAGLMEITTILRPSSYFENFESDLPGINLSYKTFPGLIEPNKPWQTIAVDDVGLWAMAVFNNPNKFIGKGINLAGEEMTGNQMAHLLTKLKRFEDKPVQYFKIPRSLLKVLEHDLATMAEWIERGGYGANIDELKTLGNELGIQMTSLSSWLSYKLAVQKSDFKSKKIIFQSQVYGQ